MTQERNTSRSQQKREQILTAAKQLFLQHGFTDTSTDALTMEAGISKETLYRYYPSKERLFVDLLRHLTREHLPKQFQVGEMLPELGSREAVRTVLLTLTQQIVSLMMQPDYLALLRVIIAEMPRFPQLGRLFYEAVPEQTMISLAHLLKKGQDEKTVSADIDIDAARRLLVGGMLTYAFLDGLFATDGEPRLPSAERLEALVDVFMRSIVSPLCTK